MKLLLVCCGDVESNLRPKKQHQISFCHQNLNGLEVHSFFIKVSLLQVISVSKNYDIIDLSDTFLGSSIDSSVEKLPIEGYNLLHRDQASNKKGKVCIYYKENLPVIKRDDLSDLNECLVLEIKIGGKKNAFFFHVFMDHQVKVERNCKDFVPTSNYSCQILMI